MIQLTPQLKFSHKLNQAFVRRSSLLPWEWCEKYLCFDEAGNHNLFTTTGSEYTRDVINDFGDSSVNDEVLVWGSQSRKTGTLMGGAAWCIVNDPCGFLWVMPSLTLAKKFSKQRWLKMLNKSESIKPYIPTGAQRHNMSSMTQMLGAAVFNFVGSNSAANVASMPSRRVILDEVDKMDMGGKEESNTVNLTEQRTKDMINPQRWKTSTPTLISGLIWQEYLKGNQMRYYVPCPTCAKFVTLVWSQQYTLLKIDGSEAFVKWDKEAKKENGEWDLDRVERSARAECPYCGNHIQDDKKPWMVKNGVWRATSAATTVNFKSRHLSSLYATSSETRFSKLAVKFLQSKRSVLGMQGFINGDLAEPYQSQDSSTERIEVITKRVELGEEWFKIMTVDCQQKAPYFWYVIRAWKDGNSQGLLFGSAETIEEIRKIQTDNEIKDVAVWIDSGYRARSGEAAVYRNCASYGEFENRRDKLPLHLGWLPCKGFPTRKRWHNSTTKTLDPYYLQEIDPFMGTSDAGQIAMNLYEFSGEYYKDILSNLRTGRTAYKWSVCEEMSKADYWKHMDGENKVTVENKITGRTKVEWRPRHRDWPNHGFDCEVLQIAAASFFGMFKIEETK